MVETMKKTLEYIQEREQNLARYSDKLRENVDKIFDAINELEISIDIQDDVSFWDTTDKLDQSEIKYFLAIKKHKLVVVKEFEGNYFNLYDYVHQLRRETLKNLVKSRRLPIFLQKVGEKLKNLEEEYAEVSEISSKITSVLQ